MILYLLYWMLGIMSLMGFAIVFLCVLVERNEKSIRVLADEYNFHIDMEVNEITSKFKRIK